MESEFFGYKKGSFTGADQDRLGFFQHADGGTLFLDEVADLPLAMQVKLLRAIQEKAVRRIGDARETFVDVRIICATHKNLEALVESGAFRQDLYYRLNVVTLHMPPLREMREDMGALILYLLYKHRHGTQTYKLSPKAQEALLHYSYPGNFRELENILERAVALTVGQVIQLDDLQIQKAPLPKENHQNGDVTLDDISESEGQQMQPENSSAHVPLSIPAPCRFRTTSTKSNATSSNRLCNKPVTTARKPPSYWASASARCVTEWSGWTSIKKGCLAERGLFDIAEYESDTPCLSADKTQASRNLPHCHS